MSATVKSLALFVTVCVSSMALAEQSGRPESMTLAGFQFGPENRWAFSHMREILPTANIDNDYHRVLVLERGEGHVDDFPSRCRDASGPSTRSRPASTSTGCWC